MNWTFVVGCFLFRFFFFLFHFNSNRVDIGKNGVRSQQRSASMCSLGGGGIGHSDGWVCIGMKICDVRTAVCSQIASATSQPTAEPSFLLMLRRIPPPLLPLLAALFIINMFTFISFLYRFDHLNFCFYVNHTEKNSTSPLYIHTYIYVYKSNNHTTCTHTQICTTHTHTMCIYTERTNVYNILEIWSISASDFKRIFLMRFSADSAPLLYKILRSIDLSAHCVIGVYSGNNSYNIIIISTFFGMIK